MKFQHFLTTSWFHFNILDKSEHLPFNERLKMPGHVKKGGKHEQDPGKTFFFDLNLLSSKSS